MTHLEGEMSSLIPKSHKGLLHKQLGMPEGKKIPRSMLRSKLKQAKKEHNVKLERRLVFALNFGKKK